MPPQSFPQKKKVAQYCYSPRGWRDNFTFLYQEKDSLLSSSCSCRGNIWIRIPLDCSLRTAIQRQKHHVSSSVAILFIKYSYLSVYPTCQHQTIPFCQKGVVVNKHTRDLFATKLKNRTFEWHEKARLHFMPRSSLSELNFPNQINRQLNFLQQGQGNNSWEPAHCTQCTVYSSNSHCLKQSD